MSGQIQDNKLFQVGYTIFRKDRRSRGGGVLIAVKSSIAATQLQSPESLEVISIELAEHVPFVIAGVYLPPNADEDYRSELIAYLRLLAKRDHLLVLGDFNLPEIDWPTLNGSSARSVEFCDMVFI